MADKKHTWRTAYHILPPKGWLNDPNGSTYYKGEYHIWFQYSPETPLGGQKYWGHYTSKDMVHFTYQGISLSPDQPFDKDGVYSGTAWTASDGSLELYYTGNVKHPGDFDYINEGRGHNVVRVTSKDGFHFSEKELLLENKDYPEDLSCHVRDPKIWQEGEIYYMLLGARRRDSVGGLLLMKSEDDRRTWQIEREFFPDGFGFMLECPDYFTLGDQNVVAFCPQGVENQENRLQNIYQSGYVLLGDRSLSGSSDEELGQAITLDQFTEWDMGFDFYAPQTFVAVDGRQILVGWAGVPDCSYGNAPSIEEGWQHSMTVLRELEVRDGIIRQNPVRELDLLRGVRRELGSVGMIPGTCFDLVIERESQESHQDFCLNLNQDLTFTVRKEGVETVASLTFINNSGDGRDVRRSLCQEFRNARILMDHCILEIYLNDGEQVFTTRYYPDQGQVDLQGGLLFELPADCSAVMYEMETGILIPEE